MGSSVNVYEYIKTNLNKGSPSVKKLRVECGTTCLMWDTRSHPQIAGFVAEKWPSSLEVLLSFLSEGLACVMGLFLRFENKDSGNCPSLADGIEWTVPLEKAETALCH